MNQQAPLQEALIQPFKPCQQLCFVFCLSSGMAWIHPSGISFSVFLLHVEIPVVVTATFGFRNHALMALNADIKETEAGSSVLHNL